MKEKGLNDSTMSIKSGVTGPYAGQADDSMLGSEGQSGGSGAMFGEGLPDRTAQRYALTIFLQTRYYADTIMQLGCWLWSPQRADR